MKKLLLFLLSFLFLSQVQSQDRCALCKAVEKENFRKVERLIRKEVRKRKQGISFYNGPGSGMQITHLPNLDTITLWLKSKPCVEDAAWDKCQKKPAIYPGWASIGAKFKTSSGIREKCFLIQKGTLGSLYIFGWRPHIFKMKNKLIYRKMYDCEGFIENEKKNCQEINQHR
ncbi:MAG: hypothetical protein FD166_1111 [Bacteroidetes bacterium]|nr:MAG: hypothetical protein FD166_1111 [Bacteroidota bacterium]